MRLLLSTLLLLCLAGCDTPKPDVQRTVSSPESAAAQCRSRPDVTPSSPTAERGIGGTGISRNVPFRQADRGIGGTGIEKAGIIGIITGFASICINDAELAYNSSVPVRIDGIASAADNLRVGQLVAIEATGSPFRLTADSVAVRHEVTGPVQNATGDGTMLTVAGQRVILDGPVLGSAKPVTGNWIAVSGLVGPGGAIHATRIDPSPQGLILVHGMLHGTVAAPQIGTLLLSPLAGQSVPLGTKVIATGQYVNGQLQAFDIVPDLLVSDPPAFFGPDIARYSIESYLWAANDRINLSEGFSVAAAGTAGFGNVPRKGVLSFERGRDGRMTATALGIAGQAPIGPSSIPSSVIREPSDQSGRPARPVWMVGPRNNLGGQSGDPMNMHGPNVSGPSGSPTPGLGPGR